MTYRLGVDIGSARTTAAVLDLTPGRPAVPGMPGAPIAGARQVRLSAEQGLSGALRSLVAADADGHLVVGEAASAVVAQSAGRGVDDLLLRLGDPTPVGLGGAGHTATDLLALLLGEVVATATRQEGSAPTEVVLAHPGGWGPFRREQFAQVPQEAGVDPVVTVPAPRLAVARHGRDADLPDGTSLVVCDWGARSFECTVLQVVSGSWTEAGASDGVERLGGDDLDAAVLSLLDARTMGALGGLARGGPAERTILAEVRRRCRTAKEELTTQPSTVVELPLPGDHRRELLTRPDLEALSQPLLVPGLEAVDRCLAAAGVQPHELGGALLVGGSARVPLLTRLLGDRLQRPVHLPAHPEAEVALAAAEWTDRGTGGQAPASGAVTAAAPAGTAGPAAGTRTGLAAVGAAGHDQDVDLTAPSNSAPRGASPARKSRPGLSRRTLITSAGAVAAVAAGGVLVSRLGGDDGAATAGATPTENPATGATTPSRSPAPASASAPSSPAPTVLQRITGLPDRPEGVALDPRGGTAYVASPLGRTVAVYNTSTFEREAVIAFDSQPEYLACSGDGQRLYVTLLGDAGSVAVVDTVARTVLGTIPVGPEPYRPALSPDSGTLYVPTHRDSAIWAVSTRAATARKLLTLDPSPHQVALSPDGGTAYVTIHEAGHLSVVDLSLGAVVQRWPTGPESLSVAVSPDGSRVLVANRDDSSVSFFDTEGTELRRVTVAGQPRNLDVAPDGRHVYVACSGSDQVNVIDALSATVTSVVPVGADPWQVTTSSDGRTAWVAASGDDTLTVLSTAEGSSTLD